MKQLEWTPETKPNEMVRYHHVTSESPLGQIRIEWKGWKAYDGKCVYINGEYITCEDTLDEAKQSAANYLAAKALELAPYISDGPFNEGVEASAKFLDAKAATYHQEFGEMDNDTGSYSYPGDGADYLSELEENAESIRGLKK